MVPSALTLPGEGRPATGDTLGVGPGALTLPPVGGLSTVGDVFGVGPGALTLPAPAGRATTLDLFGVRPRALTLPPGLPDAFVSLRITKSADGRKLTVVPTGTWDSISYSWANAMGVEVGTGPSYTGAAGDYTVTVTVRGTGANARASTSAAEMASASIAALQKLPAPKFVRSQVIDEAAEIVEIVRFTAPQQVFAGQFVDVSWRTRHPIKELTLIVDEGGPRPVVPVVTTNTDSIYRRGTTTPGTPSGGTSSENHLPSGASRTRPTATATQNVYRSRRTRTYTDGTFTSATAWSAYVKVADKTGVDPPDPVITTRTDSIYRRGATTPSTPSGGTNDEDHLPTGTSRTQPSATATQNVYRSQRTLTYTDGAFTSASAWGRYEKVADKTGSSITTDTDSIWRLGTTTPDTPSGGTASENHLPSGWSRTEPDPTATENVYRSQRTRTYTDGNFTSATAWGAPAKTADKTGSTAKTVTVTAFRGALRHVVLPGGFGAQFGAAVFGRNFGGSIGTLAPLADASYSSLGGLFAAAAAHFRTIGDENIGGAFRRAWDACADRIYGGNIFGTDADKDSGSTSDMTACTSIESAWENA